MIITIESTDQITTVVTNTGEVQARLWEGMTDSGIAVVAFITRIAVREQENQVEFEAELRDCPPPSVVFPLRMII
jgi:hypothetical protein